MSQHDIPLSSDIVVGMPGDSGLNAPQQGISSPDSPYAETAYQQQYAAEPYLDNNTQSERKQPVFDSAESSRMTPHIMVLLISAGLRRNWKWALPTGLILAAVAFGTLYAMFPKKYEATAWIQMLSQKPHFIFDEKQQSQYANLVQTQFSLIRSPLIIDKALDNPKVANLKCINREKDKSAWLVKNLRLGSRKNSELITISIETEDAQASEIIVNSIVDAYFEYYDTQAQDWNSRLVTQLTLELNRQQSAARLLQEEIRSKLEAAAQKGGAAGTEGGMGAGFAPGESLRRDVYIAESKLDSLRAEKKMLQESLNETGRGGLPQSMLENMIVSDPMIRDFQGAKNLLQQQLSSQQEILVNPNDPKIVDLKSKIQKLDKQLEKRRTDLQDNSAGDYQRQMLAGIEQAIWAKDMEIRTMEIYVENLSQRYREQIKDTGDRTVNIVDVNFQTDQLRRINSVLDLLSTRVVTLQTEMNAPDQIQLRKKATVPTSPKIAKRIPFALMGAAGCLFFPLFLGIAIERIKPRLYHVSQIRRAIPDVIIGEIMEPPVAWVHGANFRKRLARYRESVHSWCTHLLLSDPFRSCRTISVASVSGDDGKTFLAVQVAVAMAQMKSGPVLLIDGDMRVGRLHLLFGNEESGIGLADVLSFRNGFGEAVSLNENEPNLHLLSAGHLDVSPYELLGDGRFRELLDTLQTHYSLILVVIPPVSHAAESLVMAAATDSTLLCVRQGETILAAMEDVFRKLISTGSSVDGIVVKDIPYYQMAGKDGGFADKLEQIRLSHLLQYSE